MSIKSDKWIRKMSLENGMIHPFEPKQVRQSNDQKIISYGTSSYGYDVRCSTEFKIFAQSSDLSINHFNTSALVLYSIRNYIFF